MMGPNFEVSNSNEKEESKDVEILELSSFKQYKQDSIDSRDGPVDGDTQLTFLQKYEKSKTFVHLERDALNCSESTDVRELQVKLQCAEEAVAFFKEQA